VFPLLNSIAPSIQRLSLIALRGDINVMAKDESPDVRQAVKLDYRIETNRPGPSARPEDDGGVSPKLEELRKEHSEPCGRPGIDIARAGRKASGKP